MHETVLACTRSRRQMLAALPTSRPAVLHWLPTDVAESLLAMATAEVDQFFTLNREELAADSG